MVAIYRDHRGLTRQYWNKSDCLSHFLKWQDVQNSVFRSVYLLRGGMERTEFIRPQATSRAPAVSVLLSSSVLC